MKNKFKFIDLFSGIGGFHKALAPLGGECVMASDILPVANQTYFNNFGIKPRGDIAKIESKDIPDFNLLCAGFPCQSFSQIGQKGGLDDPRGELVYQIFRILEDKQPAAFILENVRGLLSHNQGKTFKYIEGVLDQLNYNVYHKVLDATDYGLPQIRKRLFIVGIQKKKKVAFEFPQPIEMKFFLPEVMGGQTERKYAFTIRIGGRRSGINNRFNWDSYIVDGKVRYITPEECLKVQGFDGNFTLCGNESEKYYQVGNSVPVTIINEIGKKLVDLKVL